MLFLLNCFAFRERRNSRKVVLCKGLCVFFLGFVCGISTNLYSQDAPASPPKNLWKYAAYANANMSVGNVRRMLLETGLRVDVPIGEIVKMGTYPYFCYGEQNGQVTEREWFADVHLQLWHKKRFYGMAFGSVEASNLRRVDFRYLTGGGVGFRILDKKPKYYLTVTNAIVYENTNFRDKETLGVLRNSTRILGEYKFKGDFVSLQHVVFIQPSLLTDNMRANGTASLAFSLAKNLKLTANARFSYESLVIQNRQNWDANFTFGIRYSNL